MVSTELNCHPSHLARIHVSIYGHHPKFQILEWSKTSIVPETCVVGKLSVLFWDGIFSEEMHLWWHHQNFIVETICKVACQLIFGHRFRKNWANVKLFIKGIYMHVRVHMKTKV